MKQERKDLPLDMVEVGMVLADEVCDARGVVLLPKGVSLSEAVLTGLERRGIETLPVLVISALSDDEAVERQQLVARRLDHLFRLAGDDRPVRELRQQIEIYMLEHR
jgi:hypothetical protein